jgi:uncharacterized integral membrane protein (TIGR00698 family)
MLAVACAASVAGALLHVPAMLLALAFGMLLNPVLSARAAFAPGLALSARSVLRLGVVLLGARVTIAEIGDLGLASVLLAVGGVVVALSGGWAIGRLLGLKSDHAALSAGAVAICGASAALAIAAVLPRRAESDSNTMLTIVGVTALSTVAMVAYPLIALALGLDHRSAGVFLGASIHDVAQVVGAGFMISEDAAETATIVKLTRIACLAPAVAALGLLFRNRAVAGPRLPVPLFLLGFVALLLLSSGGLIGDGAEAAMTSASQWCLLIAVAALGAKTSLKDIFGPGWRPLAALVLQTALLGVFALASVWLLR